MALEFAFVAIIVLSVGQMILNYRLGVLTHKLDRLERDAKWMWTLQPRLDAIDRDVKRLIESRTP